MRPWEKFVFGLLLWLWPLAEPGYDLFQFVMHNVGAYLWVTALLAGLGEWRNNRRREKERAR